MATAAKQTVGQLIKAARLAKGLSVNRLAHLTGLDPGNLARIEKGERKGTQLGHQTVEALVSALGVSATDLGYGDAAPPSSAKRTVVSLDDRYPTRPAALAALRAGKVPEELVGIVASLRAHSDEDPGVGFWMTDAVREAKALLATARKLAAAPDDDDVFATPKPRAKR